MYIGIATVDEPLANEEKNKSDTIITAFTFPVGNHSRQLPQQCCIIFEYPRAVSRYLIHLVIISPNPTGLIRITQLKSYVNGCWRHQ